MTLMRQTLALAATLAALGAARPAWAYPANFGNSSLFAPGHGLVLVNPALSTDGGSRSVWSYVTVGVADGINITADMLYLAPAGLAPAFGTSYVGTNVRVPTPLSWLSASVSPQVGLKVGDFGSNQVALRGYVDAQLAEQWRLFTLTSYYHSLDPAASPSAVTFDGALEYQWHPAFTTELEVLSGWPNWEFGPSTQAALAPGFQVSFGVNSLKGSLRVPCVKSAAAAALETPMAVLSFGHIW